MRKLENSVDVSAWVGCSIEQAIDLFINEEEVRSWLPVIERSRYRAGGEHEICWSFELSNKNDKKKKKSKKISVKCKILAIKRKKYSNVNWNDENDSHSMNHSQSNINGLVYFLPLDCGLKLKKHFTEVHLILTGFNDSTDSQTTLKWFQNTWTNAFEKLIEHVNDMYQ